VRTEHRRGFPSGTYSRSRSRQAEAVIPRTTKRDGSVVTDDWNPAFDDVVVADVDRLAGPDVHELAAVGARDLAGEVERAGERRDLRELVRQVGVSRDREQSPHPRHRTTTSAGSVRSVYRPSAFLSRWRVFGLERKIATAAFGDSTPRHHRLAASAASVSECLVAGSVTLQPYRASGSTPQLARSVARTPGCRTFSPAKGLLDA
jgi:hypothetical protein